MARRWHRLPWSTKKARTAYWLSGKLSRFHTRQTVYQVMFRELPDGTRTSVGEDGRFNTQKRKRRAPCRTSVRLLKYSMRDPHWDHWALRHGRHQFEFECPACGGCVCAWPEGPGLTPEELEADEHEAAEEH